MICLATAADVQVDDGDSFLAAGTRAQRMTLTEPRVGTFAHRKGPLDGILKTKRTPMTSAEWLVLGLLTVILK